MHTWLTSANVRALAAFAAILSLASPAPSSAVIGGSLEMGYPNVVAVWIDDGAALCSGVLVGPRVVLTAAHCIDADGAGPSPAASSVAVVVGADAGGGTPLPATGWLLHPSFAPATLEYDAALVVLAQPPGPEPVSLGEPAALVDATLTIVGYGESTIGGGAGFKRTAQLVCDSFYATSLSLTTTATVAPCSGDGGAPVLATIDGAKVLTGTVAGSTSGCLGGFAFVSRASAIAGWIGTNLAAYANSPPVAVAQTATSVEGEPVTIVLAASDVDGDPLTFRVDEAPTHGSLSGDSPDLLYTPAAGYQGTDTFTFVANDGSVDSGPATVTVEITAASGPESDPGQTAGCACSIGASGELAVLAIAMFARVRTRRRRVLLPPRGQGARG